MPVRRDVRRSLPVPLYPPVRLGKLGEYHSKTAAMLRAVDAALVVTDERIRRFLGPGPDGRSPLGLCDRIRPGRLELGRNRRHCRRVALIQFSSGTTQDPKPVALTHENLLSNLSSIERYLIADGAPQPVGVTWLPLYHDMGLIGNLLSAFYIAVPVGPTSA